MCRFYQLDDTIFRHNRYTLLFYTHIYIRSNIFEIFPCYGYFRQNLIAHHLQIRKKITQVIQFDWRRSTHQVVLFITQRLLLSCINLKQKSKINNNNNTILTYRNHQDSNWKNRIRNTKYHFQFRTIRSYVLFYSRVSYPCVYQMKFYNRLRTNISYIVYKI